MSFIDELKKLTRPYGDEDEDAREYEEEEEEQEPVYEERRLRPFDDRRSGSGSKVVNIPAASQLRVVLVKPDKFESASEIADQLKNRRTVVLNLENAAPDVARRLVDFLSGVAYGGNGRIKKIAANTYLITPFQVDIEGDLMDELESSGFYL